MAGLNATDRPKPLERPGPWRDAVARFNQSSSMNNLRGNEAIRVGRFRQAVEWYTAGLRANPTNVLVAANLGQALLALDEVTEARQVLEVAYRTGTEDPAVIRQLSLARARAGATNTALELATRWVEAHPNDAGALQIEADVRAALRDFSGAEALTLQALELKPSDVTLHVALGTYRAARGNASAAKASWERSLQILGDRPELQHNLARLLLTSSDGRVRHPAAALALARSLVASHLTALRLETLALALAETGDWDAAALIIRRAIAALGDDGSAGLRRRLQRVQVAILTQKAFRESWPFADE